MQLEKAIYVPLSRYPVLEGGTDEKKNEKMSNLRLYLEIFGEDRLMLVLPLLFKKMFASLDLS